MLNIKTAKNAWDLITRAAKIRPGSMRMFLLDGSVAVFGPENFKKDGSMKKSLIEKIKLLREDGLLA